MKLRHFKDILLLSPEQRDKAIEQLPVLLHMMAMVYEMGDSPEAKQKIFDSIPDEINWEDDSGDSFEVAFRQPDGVPLMRLKARKGLEENDDY